MSFTKLIGNERNRKVLQRLLQSGRIPSTLVFAGPEGIGKRQFALAMAKAANCRRYSAPVSGEASGGTSGEAPGEGGFGIDSCDECAVCHRIDAGTYGDVTTIQPDGQYIKVAQTRALSEEVYYRPREGRQRFFIIDEADRLREEAANSLLKTLEEPPSTSTIILITSRPDALLLTIRSRAQRLNFSPVSLTEMEKYLSMNYPRPAPDTALLARITDGRIGMATAFDLSVYRQERRVLVEMIELMAAGANRFRLLKAAEFLGKKERDDFEKDLDLLSWLLRDLFLLAAGRPSETIVNVDIAGRLEELASKIGLRRLMIWVDRFNRVRAGLRINLNRQLAMESALLELAGTQ